MSVTNLWVEKYRPRRLDDVVHHNEIKMLLKSSITSKRLPHLIFYGPAGTGKTSTVIAFARQVFGDNLWNKRLLELNASDERGIDMIRDRVKTWSRYTLATTNTKLAQDSSGELSAVSPTEDNEPQTLPPWKIILLDEADMMTCDAQSALRRVMEDTSAQTRFVLSCNYLTKIIDAITSRCVKCRFQPIPRTSQKERLSYIASRENLKISDQAYEELLNISNGDLRLAINILQSSVAGGLRNINDQDIISTAGHPPIEISKSLLEKCRRQSSTKELDKKLVEIISSGWNIDVLIKQMLNLILYDESLEDTVKAPIINVISNVHRRLLDGASEIIQLQLVAMEIQKCLAIHK